MNEHIRKSMKQLIGSPAGLAELTSLRLQGNPVAYARSYRCDVFSCFPPPQRHAVRLDGAPANMHERQRLHRRTAGSGGRMAQVHCTGDVCPAGVGRCTVATALHSGA